MNNRKTRVHISIRRRERKTKMLVRDPVKIFHVRHMNHIGSMRYRGFTLIEILVVIGIIAVLAGIVLVAVNPARQFKLARDSQRTSNVNALLNAIHQNMAEHKGLFVCSGVVHVLPTVPTIVRDGSLGSSDGDIASCIVPDYIASIPFDPAIASAHFSSTTDYNSGYEIVKDVNGRITASSTGELTPTISVTR